MWSTLLFVLAVAGTPATATPAPPTPAPYEATSHRRFDDVARWAAVFDDPARDAWQRPAALLEALDVRAGTRVADLGAGTGYFSRHLAAAVGPSGTVYALEVEPALVAHLRQRAENEGTPNVIPVLTSRDAPRLPPGGVDLVLIVDTYHHLDDRRAYLDRLRRVLAPGGRVAVVDWRAGPLPLGPPPAHKLPRDQVVTEWTQAGWHLAAAPDLLPHQYVLVFTPPTDSPTH